MLENVKDDEQYEVSLDDVDNEEYLSQSAKKVRLDEVNAIESSELTTGKCR